MESIFGIVQLATCEQGLNGLVLLFVNRNMSLDYDKVIEEFHHHARITSEGCSVIPRLFANSEHPPLTEILDTPLINSK